LRIGIGRPSREKGEVSEYVLSGFPRNEQGILQEAVAKAVDCCTTWVNDGIDASMNRFNQKKNV
jgi:peptidyl-tRNA hydrolase, PTH1 family